MANDTQPTPPAPAPTPFYLQPGFWVALLAPLSAFLALKFGVHIPAEQLAALLVSAIGVAVTLAHHGATSDAAAQNAAATITAAQIHAQAVADAAKVQAAAGANAGAAAKALGDGT